MGDKMQELFQKLDIKPKNLTLYERALSHSSYANENHLKQSYERLEFLGDAIVDLVVADYLFENFKENEGEMTKVRASYVCENALYEYSMNIGLNKYLKVGHGEVEKDDNARKAIIADIFESFTAAIYLDLGFLEARRVLINIISPYINKNITFFNDYKSALQEAVQTDKKSVDYFLVKEEGPSHKRIFTIEVRVDGITYGRGSANSKKLAEQNAAKEALEKLAK